MKKLTLGERMKEFYENRTKYFLPRKTYALIRIDGKAFHTFTKKLAKPFDQNLVNAMDNTAKALCEEIQGAKLAYVQSDEISILISDMDKPTTDAWYDYNIQKMVSVSASIATRAFNTIWMNTMLGEDKTLQDFALFDSRVWTIPNKVEVSNYFLWRQQDCIKNSISSVAQSNFSHKQLHKKHQGHMIDMLEAAGDPWPNYAEGLKNGRIITKETYQKEIHNSDEIVTRTRWTSNSAPDFSVENTNFLDNLL